MSKRRRSNSTASTTAITKRRKVQQGPYKSQYKVNWRSLRSPVPTKFPVKLVYQENVGLNPGVAGICASHVFCANGLYDPNITGAGHQPRGYDEIQALYDHYVVIAAKITVHFSNTTATEQGHTIAISLTDSSTTYSDQNNYLEGGYVSYNVIPKDQTVPIVLEMACNPNKYLGRSKPLSDPDLKGNSGLNPQEKAFFHISAQPLDKATDTSNIQCAVRIEYSAIFIEPKVPGQS